MQKLIEFTAKAWNEYALIIIYKRSRFKLLFDDLPDNIQKQLKDYDCQEYNITGFAYLDKRDIVMDSLHLNFNNYGIPVRLSKHVVIPTDYVNYYYHTRNGSREIKIQRNGFLVYCAPTGQGKTFFALTNIEKLCRQFDTVLYINF